MPKGKTTYVRKKDCNLKNSDFPVAGPRASIKVVRKQSWGKDVDIAIQGKFAYNLGIGGLERI